MCFTTFVFSAGTPRGITCSAVGLTFCAITVGIKNCKSMSKKKRKTNDKIIL